MDVFISYSSKDLVWKNRIIRHLDQMRMAEVFNYASWDDGNINLGEAWDQVIQNAIDKAKVVLLLITSDFLTSDYIMEKEVPKFRESAREGNIVIVPLMVRPSAWTRFDWLADLEHFPKGAVLSGMNDHDVEKNLTDLVDELARLVEQSEADFAPDNLTGDSQDGDHSIGGSPTPDEKATMTRKFLSKSDIAELIQKECNTEQLKTELIFSTSKQQTWMVAIPGAIVCLLDDARTQRAGRAIQWSEPIGPLTEATVTHKPGNTTIGHVGIGRRKGWLATLKNFENGTEALRVNLNSLITAARR